MLGDNLKFCWQACFHLKSWLFVIRKKWEGRKQRRKTSTKVKRHFEWISNSLVGTCIAIWNKHPFLLFHLTVLVTVFFLSFFFKYSRRQSVQRLLVCQSYNGEDIHLTESLTSVSPPSILADTTYPLPHLVSKPNSCRQ